MDDQEFKELVLKEIKDALKKALYGDFDFNVLTPLGEECPHEREKYIKAPHEEGHNREEMNKERPSRQMGNERRRRQERRPWLDIRRRIYSVFSCRSG